MGGYKVNYKGRCTKRKLSKCKDVCRTFDAIQMKLVDMLQANDEIKTISLRRISLPGKTR
ncbi:MAG: hypothetical protein IJH64_07555 [Oscillospiraceae bacterium]|nr:hypothetical protein [Oscillospiraceae bacterium]